MFTLFHHPFCPHSRFVRLALGEYGLDLRLVDERAWERRAEFLALNPAGTTPVLISEGKPAIPGAGIIAEYLDETHGAAMKQRRLLPSAMGERIEVRRLMAWFNEKFFEEVSNPLVTERIYKRFMSEEDGGGAPATDVIRAAKANVRYHLAYIGWLARTRNFLAGEQLTYADLAAAAHLSAIDYLGDVPWIEDEAAKAWYARVKSRPSFRPLLSEWLAGVPASRTYVDLDFLNVPLKLSPADLKAAFGHEARGLGFDCVGVTDPGAIADAAKHFRSFLEAGAHGDMDWLAAHPERRADPRVLWAGVRSVIMLGVNYGPDENPLAILAQRTRGAISVYAQGDDYHDLIKKRLKTLARWLVATSGAEVKVFVDTAAVMEKPLAQAAGLGWQGKHTNLVSREFGSWLFLGAIFTTSDLPRDDIEADHCGSCQACLDICPTAAFPAPYKLDARRCISYLTIESKGPIPNEFRKAIGNRIYGCDDCLAVCPWNKFAQAGRETKLAARDELRAPDLAELALLDDAAFRARFTKSPVKRIGRDRFIRNVLIAIGNSNDKGFAVEAERLLNDDSALVRGAAAWALSQLKEPEEFATLAAKALGVELDETVRAEWRGAGANADASS